MKDSKTEIYLSIEYLAIIFKLIWNYKKLKEENESEPQDFIIEASNFNYNDGEGANLLNSICQEFLIPISSPDKNNEKLAIRLTEQSYSKLSQWLENYVNRYIQGELISEDENFYTYTFTKPYVIRYLKRLQEMHGDILNIGKRDLFPFDQHPIFSYRIRYFELILALAKEGVIDLIYLEVSNQGPDIPDYKFRVRIIDLGADSSVIKAQFDKEKSVILIGDKSVVIPPYKNEYYLCVVMFRNKVGKVIDWDMVYDATNEKPSGSPLESRQVYDTVKRVNQRLKKSGLLKDDLFIWKDMTIRRKY